MAACGTKSGYTRGCRCEDCKAAHAAAAREARKARRMRELGGPPSDYELVDSAPSKQAIDWMLAQEMRWTQITALVGMERRTVYRAINRTSVARKTERLILDALKKVESDPALLTRDALLLPAAETIWQVKSLMALGYTEQWISQTTKIGRLPDGRNPKVQRRLYESVNDLFQTTHTWGPSRGTAITMWRNGHFPPDCYDWEEYGGLAIPGSLHTDLAMEATKFAVPNDARSRRVRTTLRKHGQWTIPPCARLSMRNWCEHVGLPVDDYSDEPLEFANKFREVSPWCNNPQHDHSLPKAWIR